jgi:hypothetical protein
MFRQARLLSKSEPYHWGTKSRFGRHVRNIHYDTNVESSTADGDNNAMTTTETTGLGLVMRNMHAELGSLPSAKPGNCWPRC